MKKLISLIFVITLVMFGQSAFASFETLGAGGAGGYDLVAYQTQNKAVKGQRKIFSYYQGTLYSFSSEKNKKLFDANPDKYLPAYGGYCAMAMAKGKKHPVDPQSFKIVNGKLYLNGDKKTIFKEWVKDIPGHIQKADENWEKLKDVDPAELVK